MDVEDVLIAQLLEHYAANLQLVGSDLTYTCVCGIYFPLNSALNHMSQMWPAAN